MLEILIPLTAFFLVVDLVLVIAQTAFVNCRFSLLKNLVENGEKGAARTVSIASDSSRLLLTMRFGRHVTRLFVVGMALGMLVPVLADQQELALLLLFLVLLGSGLVLGLLEFAAESIAIRNPEKWAMRMTPFVAVLERLLYPLSRGLYRVAQWLTRTPQEEQPPLITEEEIMTLVDAGEEEGVIEEEEKEMIYSIFRLDHTLAREVMVPRIDLMAFDEEVSLEEATETLLRTGHSRAPVYSGSIDNVTGLIYIKDLLAAWRDENLDQKVADLMRPAYFVPEAKKADDLLAEMRNRRVHMAVVVDEYGGTAGLVTIEDVVEEIVGEIMDEYDFGEEMPYQVLQEGEYLFSGGIDLDDVNQIAGSDLPTDTSETLGGFIYSELGKVPFQGEEVEAGGLRLTVEQVVGRRIRKIRAETMKPMPPENDHELE